MVLRGRAFCKTNVILILHNLRWQWELHLCEAVRNLREICRMHIQTCKYKTLETAAWFMYFSHRCIFPTSMFMDSWCLHFDFARKAELCDIMESVEGPIDEALNSNCTHFTCYLISLRFSSLCEIKGLTRWSTSLHYFNKMDSLHLLTFYNVTCFFGILVNTLEKLKKKV